MKRDRKKMKRIAASVVAILIILTMLVGLILPFVYGAEIAEAGYMIIA